ncbi:MAG: hypothetical protein ACRC33_19430 [Gemmataceae bacterium]
MKTLYRTRDIYLASFLISEEAEVLSIMRLGPKTVEVCFATDWRLHELLRFYWSERPLSVIPLKLFDALKVVKSRSRVRGGTGPATDEPAEGP